MASVGRDGPQVRGTLDLFARRLGGTGHRVKRELLKRHAANTWRVVLSGQSNRHTQEPRAQTLKRLTVERGDTVWWREHSELRLRKV